jgi:hypothetical protein
MSSHLIPMVKQGYVTGDYNIRHYLILVNQSSMTTSDVRYLMGVYKAFASDKIDNL